jgi:hypothetical protein
MKVLREYDCVRVAKLSRPNREFDGNDGVKRPPRIGDIAVIVHEYRPDDPTAVGAVEKVDEDGYTVWLADFDRDELEFVSGP